MVVSQAQGAVRCGEKVRKSEIMITLPVKTLFRAPHDEKYEIYAEAAGWYYLGMSDLFSDNTNGALVLSAEFRIIMCRFSGAR